MSVKTESKTPTTRQTASRNATDKKIVESILAIGREHGLSAVTIDSVAAHSGVAKTTIYRRYDDRLDMIVGASKQVHFELDLDMPASREGIISFYKGVEDHLENKIGIRLVGSLMASPHEQIKAWRQHVIAPLEAEFDRYFEQGVAAGVYRPDLDHGLLHSMIVGGMLIQFAALGTIPDDYVEKAVNSIWPLVANPDADNAEN